MRWFSHQHRTGRRKASEDRLGPNRGPFSQADVGLYCRHPQLRRNGFCCCVQRTAQWRTPYYALSMRMTQQFFVFVPGWPLPLTFDLDIRTRARFLYNVPLTAKFHHPTFNRSEVIVQTNILTNTLTNRHRWKHHCAPLYATPVGKKKSQWQNIMSVSATHGGHSNVNIGFNLK